MNKQNRLDEFINNPQKALFTLSLPMMAGMSVQAIYMLIDTAFIGKWVGGNALAGLGVIFPPLFIIMGITFGLGSGATTVIAQMIGKKAIDSARILVENLNLPISPEEYIHEKNNLSKGVFPKAEAMPGAKNLTQHMKKNGVYQAVATSSNREMLELKISKHKEWFLIFDVIVTADSPGVKNGKPAPDIFLLAAEKMSVSPDQCLVFEDAPSGMHAALSAGMSVIVVPDPKMDKNQYKEANLILDSLENFEPKDWNFPPF